MITILRRHLGLFFLTLAIMTIDATNVSAQDGTTYMRIAKITVDSTQLDEYIAALTEQMQAALSLEQGVLAYSAVQDKKNPTKITILETYASTDAYQAHILTEHFKKYKTTVADMVTQLELTDVDPIAIQSKSKKDSFNIESDKNQMINKAKLMKKLQFKIDINASAEKVYHTMLGIGNIETYKQWTSEFNPTSTYEGNWEKGSKIYFVGTDENGKRGGMVSKIADNRPFQFVSISHYGILDGDNEILDGALVEKWAGGLENYSFDEHNGVTTVTIDIDVIEDYLDYFNTSWPKALGKLKEIAEK